MTLPYCNNTPIVFVSLVLTYATKVSLFLSHHQVYHTAKSLPFTAELALQATQSLGMRLYLGVWIDEHPETFDKEFASLQRAIEHHNLDNVDGIIVGSEVLYREDQSLGYLIDRIHRVRNALQGYNIPITSADTFNKITPELANEIDFVMM